MNDTIKTTDLYIGTQARAADRLRLTVTLADEAALPPRNGRGSAWVTDLNSGMRYRLRRASCGLPNCMCALAVVGQPVPASK
jgi:hypothetical protein